MSSVSELKSKLKELGAKTTGNKDVLVNRLNQWAENNLGHVLCETEALLVPIKNIVEFPSDVRYVPLSVISKDVMKLNEESIVEWFTNRKASKGLKKGRILAMKLFIKYTTVFVNEEFLFVKTVCSGEMKKHTDYNICILLKKNCNSVSIIQCNCSCPAGVGWSSACKHIAAACYSLEHFNITGKTLEHISCTSQPMNWNKPLKSGRGVEFMSIFEITKQPLKHFETDSDTTDELLNKLVNYKTETPLLQCRAANMIGIINDHSLYSTDYCYNKLQEINKVSVDKRSSIEEQTRSQSMSKAWFRARRSRITGSIIGDVIKTVQSERYSDNPCLRNIKNKNLNFIEPIKWGRDHECIAKEEYMKITGNSVKSSGIWIHYVHNFLASSPDGVNFDLDLVLEIKCPYGIKDEEPTKASCLQQKDGIFTLKRNHNYYAQCQLHMFVTNTSCCDFVIYTKKGIFIEGIRENKSFISDMLSKANIYFKKIFAPTYIKHLQ